MLQQPTPAVSYPAKLLQVKAMEVISSIMKMKSWMEWALKTVQRSLTAMMQCWMTSIRTRKKWVAMLAWCFDALWACPLSMGSRPLSSCTLSGLSCNVNRACRRFSHRCCQHSRKLLQPHAHALPLHQSMSKYILLPQISRLHKNSYNSFCLVCSCVCLTKCLDDSCELCCSQHASCMLFCCTLVWLIVQLHSVDRQPNHSAFASAVCLCSDVLQTGKLSCWVVYHAPSALTPSTCSRWCSAAGCGITILINHAYSGRIQLSLTAPHTACACLAPTWSAVLYWMAFPGPSVLQCGMTI